MLFVTYIKMVNLAAVILQVHPDEDEGAPISQYALVLVMKTTEQERLQPASYVNPSKQNVGKNLMVILKIWIKIVIVSKKIRSLVLIIIGNVVNEEN